MTPPIPESESKPFGPVRQQDSENWDKGSAVETRECLAAGLNVPAFVCSHQKKTCLRPPLWVLVFAII